MADRELPAAETLLVSEPVGTALAAPEGRELLPHHLVAALENMEAGGRMGAADRWVEGGRGDANGMEGDGRGVGGGGMAMRYGYWARVVGIGAWG